MKILMKTKDGKAFACGEHDVIPFTAQGCTRITDTAEYEKAFDELKEIQRKERADERARLKAEDTAAKEAAESNDKPEKKSGKKAAAKEAAE